MADLRSLGDLLDICLARSEGVLTSDDWERLADLRRRVRGRMGFLGEVLVVALAGGTGSGKSSLFNALCKTQAATVGIERPTTSKSLAAVPSGLEGDISPLIDLLGIDRTVEVAGLTTTVFVDLPDFDSTFVDHRAIVDSVLSVVDAVVWVLDPEKYADAVVHDDFIKPLHQYGDQMLFVLNKADRLNGSAPLVVESLRIHLMADGYKEPQIVTTVAAASEATDLAVDELEAALAQRFDVKQAAINRLASDVGIEANRLWKVLSEDPSEDRSLDSALAMASLVSLGVTAAEVRHARREGTAG
jgi:GTP-binding protein EngB required for normal cell division